MKSSGQNKPTHIVKGNIFDALGFSASEASALKVKAELLSAILDAGAATLKQIERFPELVSKEKRNLEFS